MEENTSQENIISELVNITAKMLLKLNLTISIAESCTGGLLSNYLTNVSGSSGYFIFGAVTYSNNAKTNILSVREQVLEKYGAVSDETVRQMAKSVKKTGYSDLALAVSGIAGPSGGTPEKPVGTVYIAFTDGLKTFSKRYQFKGDRFSIKNQTVYSAIKILYNYLLEK